MARDGRAALLGAALAAALLAALLVAAAGTAAQAKPQPRAAGVEPLVVLVGGLGSDVPSAAEDPSGGAWKVVKRRLEEAGYRVFVAQTQPGLAAGDTSDVIDSDSGDWRGAAARLDRQLAAAGLKDRDVILIGHSMGGLIARAYAGTGHASGSGCRALGIVQLGTPNEGSAAADLAIGPFATAGAERLGDMAAMAAFNADFSNEAGLPIYRIAGTYFPKAAEPLARTSAVLRTVWLAVYAVNGPAPNDAVVTLESVRGGPAAGWRGCATFKAVHADSPWLSTYRLKAGCVLPWRTGKTGGAAIDRRILQQIVADVRGVQRTTPLAAQASANSTTR
jgi:pimeloyl-ACP methyl ester carboxylesterase